MFHFFCNGWQNRATCLHQVLHESNTKTLKMLLENISLSCLPVFEWHSRFKAGRVSFEDEEHSGQPSTSKMTENVEKIRKLINEDHCRTIHGHADTTGISYGVCQEI
jgi:hypothetical protein